MTSLSKNSLQTYIFKTQFLQAKRIQREIEIPQELSLYKFAEAIVSAYGFDFDHAFGFFRKVTDGWNLVESESYELFADMKDQDIELVDSGSVKNTKVCDVWKNPKDQMLFLFDYGDDWRWIITLKTFGAIQTNLKYPRVISVKGDAPEQYPDYDEEE